MLVLDSGRGIDFKGGAELSRRKAGDLIGEMGLIEGAPRSADVSAATGVSAIFWKRSDIIARCFCKEPTLAIKILWAMNEELSRRLRSASQELAESKSLRFHRFQPRAPDSHAMKRSLRPLLPSRF